jgi:hypothetical protein
MPCVICLKIESNEKLFVPKLDNLLMHIIYRHKIKFTSLGVKVGFFISTLIAKVHVMKGFYNEFTHAHILDLVVKELV